MSAVEEKKLKIWTYCLERGWIRKSHQNGFNVLYAPRLTKDDGKVRLHFKENCLRLEKKCALSVEERQVDPCHTTKWVVVDEAPYNRVTIKDQGLVFDHPQKREPRKAAKEAVKGEQ